MDRDDAVLAVERHATSKLAAAEDLEAVATLGFRGEALSSIASVSRFRLSTGTESGSGTEVEVDGGRIRSVREVGHPRGTTVRVDRLFFNVPARRKFLRADATELSHALRWFTRYALAFPDRGFLLLHGDRRRVECSPAGGRLERIAQLHGPELAEKLLPFEWSAEGLTVRGFAGRPVDALPRRDGQYLFVNGRAVQDRLLSHAVMQAYGNTVPPGRYPQLFLFLELDNRGLDVNVHPQKTEVRFRQSGRVHDSVRATLVEALSQAGAVPTLSQLRPERSAHADAVRDATLRYLESHESAPSGPRRADPGGVRGGERASAPPAARGTALHDGGARPGRGAAALAQFLESYIVAQDEGGLVLVDQHAAQERVLFERYLAEAEENRVEVQQLLFPLALELSPSDAVLVEREQEELRRLGFRVRPFGENTVRLDAVPSVASHVDPEALFRELIGAAGKARAAVAEIGSLRERLVTTAACRAAIKIRHSLTVRAMQALLNDLFATRNPTTCPHGRPVMFRLSLEEIERAFRRR
jgi:DNA mismatch repair protein MutL